MMVAIPNQLALESLDAKLTRKVLLQLSDSPICCHEVMYHEICKMRQADASRVTERAGLFECLCCVFSLQ